MISSAGFLSSPRVFFLGKWTDKWDWKKHEEEGQGEGEGRLR